MKLRASLLEAIRKIAKIVNNIDEWMVVGSFSCHMQGMETWDPQDIDILTTEKGYKIFKEKLGKIDYQEEEKSRDNFSWIELNTKINDEKISIFYEKGPEKIYTPYLLAGCTKKVVSDNSSYNCLWLEKEVEGYRKAGRIQKAKEIEDYLKKEKWKVHKS